MTEALKSLSVINFLNFCPILIQFGLSRSYILDEFFDNLV